MRYFTHIVLGSRRMRDDIGLDYPNFAFARAEAIRAAREIVGETLRQGGVITPECFVEIADADGRVLDVMSIAAIATEATIAGRHRRAFNVLPHPYLLIKPDFVIMDANVAYLQATMTDLTFIRGRELFAVFPDNPGDPDATAVRDVSAWLATILAEKQPGALDEHRYDIRRRDGTWEERYWKALSMPVLDHNGEVDVIVIHLRDVTQQGSARRLP